MGPLIFADLFSAETHKLDHKRHNHHYTSRAGVYCKKHIELLAGDKLPKSHINILSPCFIDHQREFSFDSEKEATI